MPEIQDRARTRGAAHITIYSATEPPEALTAAIGIEPDESWRKGEERGIRRRLTPTNAVGYESGIDKLRSPTDHAAALAARLRPVARQIRALVDHGASAVIRLVEHSGCDNVEAWVEAEDVQTFAAMGAVIDFDFYFDDHEDD